MSLFNVVNLLLNIISQLKSNECMSLFNVVNLLLNIPGQLKSTECMSLFSVVNLLLNIPGQLKWNISESLSLCYLPHVHSDSSKLAQFDLS